MAEFNPRVATQPTLPGEPKPCDIDHSQDTINPMTANYIENICYQWMRSKCKGRHSEFCPGYIYHGDPTIVCIPYPSTSRPSMGTLLG